MHKKRIYYEMCCCLVDCVGHFSRSNQVLFIGLVDSILWISLTAMIIGNEYIEDKSKLLNAFRVFHDDDTAQRLFEQHEAKRLGGLVWEITMLTLLFLLDIILIISTYWRRPFIPLLWCIGMVVFGLVRVGTLVYYWESHSYLIWDKFYWFLSVPWIIMVIQYFKELKEENNPKLELHLPYIRAVGSDRLIDENVPEMGDDDNKGPRPEYFVLGYTNDLTVNQNVNKWAGVDYFGKIHHFVNTTSYYQVV